MSDACPKCKSDLAYPSDNLMVCPECFHEWDPQEEIETTDGGLKILDANGNELKDGDFSS